MFSKRNGLPITSFIFGAGILIGVVLLFVQSFSRVTISHDDAISYLAATGHQGLYATSIPKDKWIAVSQWQSFWEPDNFAIFGIISQDLATYDIHPPLYFWILHIWISLYGVKLSTGPLLNIPIHIAITIMIYFGCRLLRCSKWNSSVAGLLWMLSGSIIQIGSETRQYSLLGFFAINFVIALILFRRKPSVTTAFWLFLFTTLGLLAHYYFVLLLVTAIVWIGIHFLYRKSVFPFILILCSSFLSVIAILIVHPTFYLSVIRQQNQSSPFLWKEISFRSIQCISALLKLFIPGWNPIFPKIILLILIGVIFFFGINIILHRKSFRPLVTFFDEEKYLVLVIATITLLGIFFLHIIAISPIHAMEGKYIILVSPLLFIVLGQFLTQADKKKHKYVIIFSIFLLISQLIYGGKYIHDSILKIQPFEDQPLMSPIPIILDSTHRGILPTVLWHANPNSQVYAASQESILNKFPALDNYPYLYYISVNSYGNNTDKQSLILHIFSDLGYKYIKLENGIYGVGEVFLLQKEN